MPRRKINLPAKKGSVVARQTAEYRHAEETPARPDVGTQPQYKKRAAPKTYHYDSSLAPALDWDGQNPAREQGEALIAALEARILNLRETIAKVASGKTTRLDAVNAEGSFRRWGYVVAKEVSRVRDLISAAAA